MCPIETYPGPSVQAVADSSRQAIYIQGQLYTFVLSVLHWWQIKTNISGGTQHNPEVVDRLSSKLIYKYTTHPPSPPVSYPLYLGELGGIVYFKPQVRQY